MLVEVNRAVLLKMLNVARDDRGRPWQESPYLRIQADGDEITLSGFETEALFEATVREPGVLFIRAGKFRQLVGSLKKVEIVTVKCDANELAFDDVRVQPCEFWLSYPDPATAPRLHPSDSEHAAEPRERRIREARDRFLSLATSLVQQEADRAVLFRQEFDSEALLAELARAIRTTR